MSSETPHDPSAFSMNLGEDLFAEALAAVEKRMPSKPPAADPSDLPASDGPDEPAIEFELDFDLDDDGDGVNFELPGETDEPAPAADGGEAARWREEAETLASQLDDADAELRRMGTEHERLTGELEEKSQRAERMEKRARRESRDRRRAEAQVERYKEQTAQARRAAQTAREARDAAEQSAQMLREAMRKQQAEAQRQVTRHQRDLEERGRRTGRKVLLELLPVLDALTMAIEHAEADTEQLLQGVRMTAGQFRHGLGRLSVAAVTPRHGDAFSPELHEATEQIVCEDIPAGTVADVSAVGYTWSGRLLRAARVRVAMAPPEPEVVEVAGAQDAETPELEVPALETAALETAALETAALETAAVQTLAVETAELGAGALEAAETPAEGVAAAEPGPLGADDPTTVPDGTEDASTEDAAAVDGDEPAPDERLGDVT